MIAFLAPNGWRLEMADDDTLGRWFEALIEGRMSEGELADAIHPFIGPEGGRCSQEGKAVPAEP